MKLESCSPWCLLIQTLFVSFLYGTPIHNHLEADSPLCPTSWFLYGKFCVTQAPSGSERTVALYCDGLGGIGINGLCIIKARIGVDDLAESELESGQDFASLLTSPAETTVMEELDVGEGVDEKGLCPEGWAHFQSMCVLKSWSGGAECYAMDAVYFRGMCLKHADARGRRAHNGHRAVEKTKRICCCAHISAEFNGLGC